MSNCCIAVSLLKNVMTRTTVFDPACLRIGILFFRCMQSKPQQKEQNISRKLAWHLKTALKFQRNPLTPEVRWTFHHCSNPLSQKILLNDQLASFKTAFKFQILICQAPLVSKNKSLFRSYYPKIQQITNQYLALIGSYGWAWKGLLRISYGKNSW